MCIYKKSVLGLPVHLFFHAIILADDKEAIGHNAVQVTSVPIFHIRSITITQEKRFRMYNILKNEVDGL